MHEYSIVQALVERVEAEARTRGATAVHRLSVRIGELSGVDVELFTTAYDTFRDRTICQAAAIDVHVVPSQWACEACGGAIVKGGPLRCSSCGGAARLAAGDEIVLDRIELEVPDV
jgi:hydrogenase nickel incorporation protein HypA/HybF